MRFSLALVALLVIGVIAGCKKSGSDGDAPATSAGPSTPVVQVAGFYPVYEMGSTIWGTFTVKAADELECTVSHSGIVKPGMTLVPSRAAWSNETVVWVVSNKSFLPGEATISMVKRGGGIVSQRRVVVAPLDGRAPDLVITSVDIPQPLYEGSFFTAVVKVQNNGNRVAWNLGLGIPLLDGYPMADHLRPMLGVEMVDPTSPPKEDYLYPGFSSEPGISSPQREFLVTGRVGAAGTHRLDVQVVDDDVILESNEMNNGSSLLFEVIAYPQ